MLYRSTSGTYTTDLRGAIADCYAPDGTLYMPERIPVLPQAYFNNISEMSLREIAYVVANSLLGGDSDSATLKSVVDESLDFDLPLRSTPSGVHVLEMFHGPTHAFKDISARFMASYLRRIADGPRSRLIVLVATTGNTGAAIADAFGQMDDVDVVVLMPRGAVSNAEMSQYATFGPGIHAVDVGGTIAQCKQMVREVLADADAVTRDRRLISANTHNILRLIPQIACFIHAYASLQRAGIDAVNFTVAVPCGNLSNLVSAVMARRMGLPLGRIVAGCTINDGLVSVANGVLAPEDVSRQSHKTYARAMDSGYPTNLPRLLSLYRGNLEAFRADIVPVRVTDGMISQTIMDVDGRDHYLLDPHTAVAYSALMHVSPAQGARVVLATAHPGKSASLIEGITARHVEPLHTEGCFNTGPRRIVKMAPTSQALKKFIITNI